MKITGLIAAALLRRRAQAPKSSAPAEEKTPEIYGDSRPGSPGSRCCTAFRCIPEVLLKQFCPQ